MGLAKRVLRPVARGRVLWTYRRSVPGRWLPAAHYLLRGRELSNFTYDIENADELVPFLAAALGRAERSVSEALAELEADREFHRLLAGKLSHRRDREHRPMLGRRAGWYCVVRVEKPEFVVETGTRDGLGSAVIACAIDRNRADGVDGRLFTFDVNHDSGWVIPNGMREVVELHIGDTSRVLRPAIADRQVGVFIHDSLHSYEHERLEFEIAFQHRADRLVLISDNAHATTALADFARDADAPYAFFREQPLDHFYPGGGIGICVVGAAATDPAR